MVRFSASIGVHTKAAVRHIEELLILAAFPRLPVLNMPCVNSVCTSLRPAVTLNDLYTDL